MDRELIGDLRRREWHFVHALLSRAFNPQPLEDNHKPFQKLVSSRQSRKTKPTSLTEVEQRRWFSFESFLELVGLATLNQEDSGGLYALHAHVNHSCEPNLMVSLSWYSQLICRPVICQNPSVLLPPTICRAIPRERTRPVYAGMASLHSSRVGLSIPVKSSAFRTLTFECLAMTAVGCCGNSTVSGAFVRNVKDKRTWWKAMIVEVRIH